MLCCDRGRAGAVVQVQSAEEMTPRHGSDAGETGTRVVRGKKSRQRATLIMQRQVTWDVQ